MITIKGIGASQGMAIGPIRFYKKKPVMILREKIDNTEKEIMRFENARIAACAQLDALYQEAKEKTGDENAAIFDIHKMMLEDLDYRESVTDMIRVQKVNAEYAVSLTAQKFGEMFASMDSYMKGRTVDVIDISERVQMVLNPELYKPFKLRVPSILAAIDISPSEVIQLDKKMILGFATVEGSASSHTTILAKSMLIPAIVGINEGLTARLNGKLAILDGYTGTLYIEPDDATKKNMQEKLENIQKKRDALSSLKGFSNVTQDGTKIDVFANVDHLSGIDEAIDNDAGGIGLFRSEFLYLGRNDYPTEDEQFLAYKRVAESMNEKKVTIRTLDIGADKQADYFNLPKEENPALGLRAIRICLTRPEIFRTQLRALYRASAFGNVAIMFPMVISVKEVADILKITDGIMADLACEHLSFDKNTERGIMIETPAAVMISGALAQMVDFFSIGTNDLTQYTLALDRQNNSLECFYDPYHPAVFKLIEMTVQSAHKAGIRVGICGELGSDLKFTEEFLRMRVDELSVSAGMVLPLREKIRSLNLR